MFDNRFTIHANLGWLYELGTGFTTPRRRTAKMISQLLASPPDQWQLVRLGNFDGHAHNPLLLVVDYHRIRETVP